MPKIDRVLTWDEERLAPDIYQSVFESFLVRDGLSLLSVIGLLKHLTHYEDISLDEGLFTMIWSEKDQDAIMCMHYQAAEKLTRNTYQKRPEQSWGFQDYIFGLLRKMTDDNLLHN